MSYKVYYESLIDLYGSYYYYTKANLWFTSAIDAFYFIDEILEYSLPLYELRTESFMDGKEEDLCTEKIPDYYSKLFFSTLAAATDAYSDSSLA